MNYTFEKVNFKTGLDIVSWEYPAPYGMYNMRGSLLALDRLMEGCYYSVFFKDELFGFFCYGSAAQLMGKKDHELYDRPGFLDVGLGLHPACCDQGYGRDFVRAGLVFAREQKWSGGFRLTVASNNLRAFTIYTYLGFKEAGRIAWDEGIANDFVVMTLDTFEPTLPSVLDD